MGQENSSLSDEFFFSKTTDGWLFMRLIVAFMGGAFYKNMFSLASEHTLWAIVIIWTVGFVFVWLTVYLQAEIGYMKPNLDWNEGGGGLLANVFDLKKIGCVLEFIEELVTHEFYCLVGCQLFGIFQVLTDHNVNPEGFGQICLILLMLFIVSLLRLFGIPQYTMNILKVSNYVGLFVSIVAIAVTNPNKPCKTEPHIHSLGDLFRNVQKIVFSFGDTGVLLDSHENIKNVHRIPLIAGISLLATSLLPVGLCLVLSRKRFTDTTMLLKENPVVAAVWAIGLLPNVIAKAEKCLDFYSTFVKPVVYSALPFLKHKKIKVQRLLDAFLSFAVSSFVICMFLILKHKVLNGQAVLNFILDVLYHFSPILIGLACLILAMKILRFSPVKTKKRKTLSQVVVFASIIYITLSFFSFSSIIDYWLKKGSFSV